MDLHSTYAARFAEPYLASQHGERDAAGDLAEVLLVGHRGSELGKSPATVLQITQDEPEPVDVGGVVQLRYTTRVRSIRFQKAELTGGVLPQIGMKVVLAGDDYWPIRRIVEDQPHAIEVECEQKVRTSGPTNQKDV